MKKKKKSFTGYTYNSWKDDFRFYEECWHQQMIDVPNIYKTRMRDEDWGKDSLPIKKIRITIEEL